MGKRLTYQILASAFRAWQNLQNSGGNPLMHEVKIETIMKKYAPNGLGIDNGIEFSFLESGKNLLVFEFGFHHLDGNGSYVGWSKHKLSVTPDLAFGFNLQFESDYSAIESLDGVDEYLYDLFSYWLKSEIEIDN